MYISHASEIVRDDYDFRMPIPDSDLPTIDEVNNYSVDIHVVDDNNPNWADGIGGLPYTVEGLYPVTHVEDDSSEEDDGQAPEEGKQEAPEEGKQEAPEEGKQEAPV